MSVYSTQEAFDLYVYYLALKRHFTSDYDFFKYNGKVKASLTSFESRNDKFQFYKLSRKKHARELILANMIVNPSIWIGDLLSDDAEEIYLQWEKKQQAFSYHFQNDLNQLDENFNSNFRVVDGQHPKLLQLYSTKKINLETIIVIDDLVHSFQYWESRIRDPIIFPQIKKKANKVKPFITYDKDKMKKIVLAKFS
jgi:hypothetical protein